MAFLYPALAIILVCVFKHLEKLPLGGCFEGGDSQSVGIRPDCLFSFSFPFSEVHLRETV